MLPNRITCQQKWIRGHLFQEGGEGGNHSKLADKGRVCLFVYLWGGGGGKADILHLHFTFYRSSFLNSPHSNQEPYPAKAYLGFCKHKASTHFNPWVERGWESRVLLKKEKKKKKKERNDLARSWTLNLITQSLGAHFLKVLVKQFCFHSRWEFKKFWELYNENY